MTGAGTCTLFAAGVQVSGQVPQPPHSVVVPTRILPIYIPDIQSRDLQNILNWIVAPQYRTHPCRYLWTFPITGSCTVEGGGNLCFYFVVFNGIWDFSRLPASRHNPLLAGQCVGVTLRLLARSVRAVRMRAAGPRLRCRRYTRGAPASALQLFSAERGAPTRNPPPGQIPKK